MSCKLKYQSPKVVSFINDDNDSDAVYNNLLGAAYANENMIVLENYNIVLRKDHKNLKGKVKLLAGGGAGIEPAETGCIGPGMLTGAVFGELFVAPSCHSILVAIRELANDHPDGVLLLVKNYLGDKLNFSMALQKAVNEKIPVKMLLIGDDSVSSEPRKSGRRGLAGSVLVYKIAGAMAEAGKSLEDIFHACREKVLTDLTSVSMCLTPSPSIKWLKSSSEDIPEVMIGVGAYGQPGFKTKYQSLNKTIGSMINIITNVLLKKKVKGPLVVLINNLGATSKLEESVICTEVISELLRRCFPIARFYTGTFMSLLDTKGFSITLLKVVDPDTLKYVDAPASASSWPKSIFSNTDMSIEKPIEKSGEKPVEKSADKQSGKLTEKTEEKSTEKSTEKSDEEAAEKRNEKQTRKPTDKPNELPAEESDVKPTKKSVVDKANQTTDEAAAKTICKSMDKYCRTSDMKSFVSSIIVKPSVNHMELDELAEENKLLGPALHGCTRALKQVLTFAAEALISCEKQLNTFDMEVGDGDAGTMLKKGAVALKRAIDDGQINTTHPYKLLQDLSKIADRHIGGTTGALYSSFFSSASEAFKNATDTGVRVWCDAFRTGVNALKYYGGAKMGERTLLDPLQPAVDVFMEAAGRDEDFRRVAANVACTCEFYSERTKRVKPYYVRGNYVTNITHPDPGAHAVSVWIRALTFEPDLAVPSPGIFTWKFLSEEEAAFVLRPDTSKKDLMQFFDDKLAENDIQQILLFDTLMYCRKNFGSQAKKTSSLISIMYYTHKYYTASLWRTPDETYTYFKESLLRHSMEYPPVSVAVFEPEEARKTLLFFIELYMRNLPLTRLVCLPHYKLRLDIKNETEGHIQTNNK